MKNYLDFNTKKRINAANDGKTMENLRKRISMRLVNNAEDFLKIY